MKCIIAGGLDLSNYDFAKIHLNIIFKNGLPSFIISGRCDTGIITFTTTTGIHVCGADGIGERYAKEIWIPVLPFPYLKQYGKAGGPMRNRNMAEAATNLIAFWDGRSRGTKSMIEIAKELNLPTRIINY